jgi:protein-tyrosine phosphatase
MLRAEVHWIKGIAGRLAIMPMPRGGEWLEDEMQSLKKQGVDVLISMLTNEEMQELALDAEARLADMAGIQFCRLPMEDRSVPSDSKDMITIADRIRAQLTSGIGVAVHCRAGVGRSTLLLACVLMKMGLSAVEALRLIATTRGCPVPDTIDQREWIERLQGGIE